MVCASRQDKDARNGSSKFCDEVHLLCATTACLERMAICAAVSEPLTGQSYVFKSRMRSTYVKVVRKHATPVFLTFNPVEWTIFNENKVPVCFSFGIP